MSFRIVNVVASAPVPTVNAQTVSSTTVTTSQIDERVAGEGVRISDVTVIGNTVYAGGVSIKNTTANKSIAIEAPDSLTNDMTIKLPDHDGTSGQVLITNGASEWDWTTIAGGSTTFQDTDFRVISTANGGLLKFDANLITPGPGSMRTITMPDADVNLTNVPNQTVSTTSSPVFSAVSAATVNADNISEKTALAGVNIKSNAKKCVSISGGKTILYDAAENKAATEYRYTGTISAGAGTPTLCTITLTTDSHYYMELTVVAKNSTSFEAYRSCKILSNPAGTLAATNIVDIVRHDNFSYLPSGATFTIKSQQTANIKTYCASITLYPLTTASDCTVSYVSP